MKTPERVYKSKGHLIAVGYTAVYKDGEGVASGMEDTHGGCQIIENSTPGVMSKWNFTFLRIPSLLFERGQ